MDTANMLKWFSLLAVVISIAIVMLKLIPLSLLAKFGRFISPNMLSIIHAPIVWIGYVIYVHGWVYTGLSIVVFGAILDRMDGKLAAILDKKYKDVKRKFPETFWEALWYKGGSDWGKIIDPAADKFAILPIYAHIAYQYGTIALVHNLAEHVDWILLLGTILIGATILVDILGIAIRMDYFKSIVKSKGATWAGKIKALCQWIWLLFYIIDDQSWIPQYRLEFSYWLDLFLMIVLSLGVISLITKVISWGHRWTDKFKHRVDD